MPWHKSMGFVIIGATLGTFVLGVFDKQKIIQSSATDLQSRPMVMANVISLMVLICGGVLAFILTKRAANDKFAYTKINTN